MAGENPAFLKFVRTLRCCAPHDPAGCAGIVQAHHAGRRGVGQKAHDETAIPLCTRHHQAWHTHWRPFLWCATSRREWADERIEEVQARWNARAA